MHGAAQWASFIMLGMGGSVIIPDEPRKLDPHDFLRTIEREKGVSCTIVGDAFARPLLDQLAKEAYDLSSLMIVGSGGAPLSTAHKQEFLERIPHVTIIDSIGSSETGAQASNPTNKSTAASTGDFRPLAGAGVVSAGPDARARSPATTSSAGSRSRAACRSATSATPRRPRARSR